MKHEAGLTREQKRKIVEALKRAAGNMAEFWGESDYESELRDIPSQDGIAWRVDRSERADHRGHEPHHRLHA